MTGQPEQGMWEKRAQEMGARVDDELRRIIRYMNDEIVPDVRRNGSVALRSLAAELTRLAERMESPSASEPPHNVPR